ncbi:hypothetical protein F4860DRAFT_468526, partial [Xylaria cubensis]
MICIDYDCSALINPYALPGGNELLTYMYLYSFSRVNPPLVFILSLYSLVARILLTSMINVV